MKVFKNIFKKKDKPLFDLGFEEEDLKKIKKKDRKRAIKLYGEYQDGLVIQVDKDINQKDLMFELRKKQ